jgi:hypothetical protein
MGFPGSDGGKEVDEAVARGRECKGDTKVVKSVVCCADTLIAGCLRAMRGEGRGRVREASAPMTIVVQSVGERSRKSVWGRC